MIQHLLSPSTYSDLEVAVAVLLVLLLALPLTDVVVWLFTQARRRIHRWRVRRDVRHVHDIEALVAARRALVCPPAAGGLAGVSGCGSVHSASAPVRPGRPQPAGHPRAVRPVAGRMAGYGQSTSLTDDVA